MHGVVLLITVLLMIFQRLACVDDGPFRKVLRMFPSVLDDVLVLNLILLLLVPFGIQRRRALWNVVMPTLA